MIVAELRKRKTIPGVKRIVKEFGTGIHTAQRIRDAIKAERAEQ